MGIRGFGTIFGEQQTGDVGNVGIDLFFEMLFESLSKVCSGSRSFSSSFTEEEHPGWICCGLFADFYCPLGCLFVFFSPFCFAHLSD